MHKYFHTFCVTGELQPRKHPMPIPDTVWRVQQPTCNNVEHLLQPT